MTKRLTLLLAGMAMAALLVATAGMAVAKNISCSKPLCSGTKNADLITASDLSQTILAKGGNDRVFALGGNDTVYGQGGADRASGGEGDDRVYGGGGNDTLYDTSGPATGAPPDDDYLEGGPGKDSLDVKDGDTLDVICVNPGDNDTESLDPGEFVNESRDC